MSCQLYGGVNLVLTGSDTLNAALLLTGVNNVPKLHEFPAGKQLLMFVHLVLSDDLILGYNVSCDQEPMP